MVFVDSNIFIYAVGAPSSQKEPCRRFLRRELVEDQPLVTSAHVLQELHHVYLRQGRLGALEQALTLCRLSTREIWTIEAEDVYLIRSLHSSHQQLESSDLLHIACCQRRGVSRVATFDRALAAAFDDPIDWTRYA
jgi:predicted nucleic acid-binding protein